MYRIKRFGIVQNMHSEGPSEVKLEIPGLIMKKTEPLWIAKQIARVIPPYKRAMMNNLNYTVFLNNKNIGDILLDYEPGDDQLYLNWMGIDSNYQKRGFASAILKWVIKFAKEKKIHRIYLESTPEGHTLYKKLGFKDISDPRDAGVWGTLVDMELMID